MTKEKKGTFTLIVPKNASETEKHTLELKDIDRALYVAIIKLVKADKELEAVELMVRNTYIGDKPGDVEAFCADWKAVLSANQVLGELITPLEGELKKN